jgi:hypothetical protein
MTGVLRNKTVKIGWYQILRNDEFLTSSRSYKNMVKNKQK